MIGAGVGLGVLFGNYLQAAIRNPSAAASQQTMLFLGMALTETMGLFAFVVVADHPVRLRRVRPRLTPMATATQRRHGACRSGRPAACRSSTSHGGRARSSGS